MIRVEPTAEELADAIDAKLRLVAAMMERRGFLERPSWEHEQLSSLPKRIVQVDVAANGDLTADLRFMRDQITRSLELLEFIPFAQASVRKEPE